MSRILSFFFMLFALIFGVLGKTAEYDPAQYAAGLPASVTEGDVRVQLLRDSLVRIETKGPKGFENRPSFTVEKRTGWDTVSFTEKTESGYRVIAADRYTVYVPLGAKSAAGCYIADEKGEQLWRFETDTDSNVVLPSPSDELKSWYFTDTPRVIPSKDGYSTARNIYRYNGWDLDNQAQDIFVFLPHGDYAAFTRDFTDLTGKSEMISLNLLGFWDSRYYEYTQETALRQIKDYYDREYPLDVLVIDTDWRQQTNNRGTGYTVSRKHFPNFELFTEKAHAEGVSLVFNDHPEPTRGNKNLLQPYEIYYRNSNLQRLLGKGLDYWWYDRNWWTTVNPVDEGLSRYVSGMYAYQWITKDYYEKAAGAGFARRPLIMANVDGIANGVYEYPSELAAHRYTLQWTGDIGPAASSLRQELENMVFLSTQTLLPYTSSDLGGHTAEVSPEQYIRWIQYGALSPIMRVHCTKPYSRMPWLYGEKAEAVTHRYVNLRYRLLPLFYALAHENYENGTPLLRRTDVRYPQYAEADRDDEYLLGDGLLVAPVADAEPVCGDYSFRADGQAGLRGEFYPNTDFSGTPEIVTHDERVWFDWGFNAPNGLSVPDYFTVRWTGTLTVGDRPLYFTAYADDGVRVYIDGEKVIDGWGSFNTTYRTDWLEANSTHDIKIEYCDGNNHAHIFFNACAEGDCEREVFLPEGVWTDVWTGESHAGPATVTVSCPLDRSPLFVRQGSVIPLADNMKNTAAGDWSHLTLDVYPSASREGTAALYEDDAETVAYQNGRYRTTEISLRGGAEQTLAIAPAKGRFEGKRAFENRSYTVRVHQPAGWGALTAAALNGKAVAFTALEKDAAAEPLALTGGARDGTVYEMTFTADVYKESELTFTFASAKPDGKNNAYNAAAADFTVGVKALQKETAGFSVPAGAKDYLLCGVNAAMDEIRKANGSGRIGQVKVTDRKWGYDDNYPIRWTGGDRCAVGETTCGIVSSRCIRTTLQADGSDTFRLYLGGHRSVAQLTVRDRAGNVRTVSFGDMSGSYYREITVAAAGQSELEVTYSLLCGSNITAAAIVAE